jgi:hypothetical protein
VPGRSRRVLTATALTILSVLIGGTATAQTRRAVIVGIDKYIPSADASSHAGHDSARPPDAWIDLEGAVNDAEAMRQVLVTRYGFKAADVHVLENDAATGDRILAEIRSWLLEAAAPGDVSVFYYAGHGSQIRNSLSMEPDKMDETIVPADANRGRADLRDKELGKSFNDILDKHVNLTVIFDSCHSGSMSRSLAGPVRNRGIVPASGDSADPSSPPALESRGALVLSASQSHQTASEVMDADNIPHGLFTWALLRTLLASPVDAPADRLFASMRALIRTANPNQEPDLSATVDRRRAALFGARGPQSAATVAAVQSVDGNGTVHLDGGISAGIRKNSELRGGVNGSPASVALRVVGEDGITLIRAVVTSGDAAAIRPGMLFAVTRWAAPDAATLRVFPGNNAPPLQLGAGTANDAIEVLPSAAGADYMLVTRNTISGGARPEYAWQRVLGTGAAPGAPLPERTDWVSSPRQIEQMALRLGAVRAWLLLESPPDSGAFPFHLALRNSTTDELRTSGQTREGEGYGLVLAPEENRSGSGFSQRYVYVFALDSDGNSTLLFPSAAGGGSGENFLPAAASGLVARELIPLGPRERFKIQKPFGIDTFVMLTTQTPLSDPDVLQGPGVRTRDLKGAANDPLGRLLSQVGASKRRAVPLVTPTEWSIQRLIVESLAK